jgi:AcrR family transcriptional regulator
VERGNQTRRLILRRTTDIASLEGLEALSLGRLATELQLSKSGVFALFGSKEELQLATVRAAAAIYVEHVVRPTLAVPAGLSRIWTLCEAWAAYSQGRIFPGGCFFQRVRSEFSSSPGPVRDAIVAVYDEWRDFIRTTIEGAQQIGDVEAGQDAEQLTFEISALLEAANDEAVLRDSLFPYDRARTAIRTRLLAIAPNPPEFLRVAG